MTQVEAKRAKPKVHHKGVVEQSCFKAPPPTPQLQEAYQKRERDGKLEKVENLIEPSLAK
jgi:hypothetical protein